MREIKFRAKIRSFNQWIFFNLLNEINSDKVPSEFMQYHLDEKTVGQYTGLKDKNGVEIYEGDIIEVPDNYDIYGMNAGEKYEIFFNAGGFRCKPKINPKAKGIWLEDDGEFLVIGNIHEHPELLK